MSTSEAKNLPMVLRTARRQFDRWRRQHRPHTRLPEELWRKAVTLARQHGLNRTADALGLKYYSLKKRIEAPVVGVSKAREVPCEFVEFLPTAIAASSLACTIELDDGSGTTVRMHVKGICMADLASFASAFRNGRV
jgi:hypothetical protein